MGSPETDSWLIRSRLPDDPPGQLEMVDFGRFIVPSYIDADVTCDDRPDWPKITLKIFVRHHKPLVYELRLASPPSYGDPGRRRVKKALADVSAGDLDDFLAGNPRPETLETMRHFAEAQPATRAMGAGQWEEAERLLLAEPADDVAIITPIDSVMLRQIPVGRLANLAVLGHAFYIDNLGEIRPVSSGGIVHTTDVDPRVTALLKILATESHTGSTNYKRNRITDELLKQVATIYRDAIHRFAPPKKTVAAELRVSLPTAGRYIAAARKRGFLGHTTPGKKGEAHAP